MDTDPSPAIAPPLVRKLGKLAKKIHLDTLRAASFVSLPGPPEACDYGKAVAVWPMFGNNAAGDCAEVGPAHLAECWSANAGGECVVTTADCITAYSAITGYDPSKPETDQGSAITDVLAYWRDIGIGVTKIEGWASIHPSERDVMKLAVAETGGLILGFDLPLSVQSQTTWGEGGAGGNDTPGSWGGHCVCAVAYNANYLYVVSWGELIPVTWAFVERYCDEAYACLSAMFFAADTAPNGFDRAAMKAALAALQGAA
jgi:hypothetical protein